MKPFIQTQADLTLQHGQHFSVAHAGDWRAMRQHVFAHPILGKVAGKLFLKEPLQMSALELSLGVQAPGQSMPILHAHRENEEVYIFVKGRGDIVVDGEVIPVREGTVVRVAPEGARAWRSAADTELHYIVVQARAGTLDNGTITDGYLVEGVPIWKTVCR